jgi:hypothetical protein
VDLPPLYARWARDLLGADIPRETEATCADCAMVGGDDVSFRPDTKCCTFYPVLPNFLVGRLLDVPSIAARIDAGVGATPLGLEAPAAYRAVYGAAASTFGRARSMRCPHYLEDGGLCAIWDHRNATCSTWFCKHVRGAVGDRFWRAIGSFLHILEVELSLLCVERLGLDPGGVLAVEPSRPTAAELDASGEPDPGKRWGTWVGRERELYRACAELVAPMTLAEILAAIGPRARLAGRVAGARFADLRDTRVPERVTLGLVQIRRHGDAARVTAYRPYDPIEIPVELASVLWQFDGRPWREVAAEHGFELDEALVRLLVDFEVLR